jgi:hypothetical protein
MRIGKGRSTLQFIFTPFEKLVARIAKSCPIEARQDLRCLGLLIGALSGLTICVVDVRMRSRNLWALRFPPLMSDIEKLPIEPVCLVSPIGG